MPVLAGSNTSSQGCRCHCGARAPEPRPRFDYWRGGAHGTRQTVVSWLRLIAVEEYKATPSEGNAPGLSQGETRCGFLSQRGHTGCSTCAAIRNEERQLVWNTANQRGSSETQTQGFYQGLASWILPCLEYPQIRTPRRKVSVQRKPRFWVNSSAVLTEPLLLSFREWWQHSWYPGLQTPGKDQLCQWVFQRIVGKFARLTRSHTQGLSKCPHSIPKWKKTAFVSTL